MKRRLWPGRHKAAKRARGFGGIDRGKQTNARCEGVTGTLGNVGFGPSAVRLRDGESVLGFDTQASDGAVHLGVPQQ